MMKGTDIVGRPVYARDTGTKAGEVRNLVIDRGGSLVLGLLLDEGGWFKDARVVSWPAILVVGPDAVIIDSEKSVVKAAQVPDVKDVLDRGYVLIGVRVQTHDGRDMGRIDDFYFSPATGTVEGYELSGGLAAQYPSGRAFLPATSKFEAGEDVAFVDPSAVEKLKELK